MARAVYPPPHADDDTPRHRGDEDRRSPKRWVSSWKSACSDCRATLFDSCTPN